MCHWKNYLRDCEDWNLDNVVSVFLTYINKMPEYVLERHQLDLFGALFYEKIYNTEMFSQCLLGILKNEY
jgi:hypothetical protein